MARQKPALSRTDPGAPVAVIAGAEPGSSAPRVAAAPSHDLLEVNAGWAAAHGVVADTPLRFENLSP